MEVEIEFPDRPPTRNLGLQIRIGVLQQGHENKDTQIQGNDRVGHDGFSLVGAVCAQWDQHSAMVRR